MSSSSLKGQRREILFVFVFSTDKNRVLLILWGVKSFLRKKINFLMNISLISKAEYTARKKILINLQIYSILYEPNLRSLKLYIFFNYQRQTYVKALQLNYCNFYMKHIPVFSPCLQ